MESKLKKIILFIKSLLFLNSGKICVTKDSGKPCKFPWIYSAAWNPSLDGKKYNGCADTDGSGAYWCPTGLGEY